jgi:predicted RNase H-like HicB family nuclease
MSVAARAVPLFEPYNRTSVKARAAEQEQRYPVTLAWDDTGEGSWIATVDALPGCSARGATSHEALDRATAAITAWLEAAEREGRDIPEPKTSQSHSGRLLLRMPQTLHAELSRAAERERVSLNQFITDVLAGALSWRSAPRSGRLGARPVPPADGASSVEAVSEPGATGGQRRTRVATAVFVANAAIVAVAAIVAIIVLIAASR